MLRTRKALLAVLGSSLLFFFTLSTTATELHLLFTGVGTNAGRRGEGRPHVPLPSPAFFSWFVVLRPQPS